MDIGAICVCITFFILWWLGTVLVTIMRTYDLEAPMKTKLWLKSKTLWINILTAIILLANQVTQIVPLSAQVLMWITLGVAILNIILRLLTDSKVTLTQPSRTDKPGE